MTVELGGSTGQQVDILVLVDLGSVVPGAKSVDDVIASLEGLTGLVERAIPKWTGSPVVDATVRFYGGFIAHEGSKTTQYSWLLRSLKYVRKLQNGIRFNPHIVLALACEPSALITGTYRGGKQRMVDQMLAQDVLFLGPTYSLTLIVADDEDYFPAILAAASARTQTIRWLRQRNIGRNDAHLRDKPVTLLSDMQWPT